MAEVLPINFPVPAERATANYNYTDIANGSGISIFYGASERDSAGTNYYLTPDIIYSDLAVFASAVSVGTIFDQNFDIVFNTPRTINGTAYANIPIGIGDTTGVSSVYLVWYLYKVSGGVDSLLGYIQSVTLVNVGTSASVNTFLMNNLKIALSNINFKKGDSLRCRIVVTGVGATAGKFILGHDPASREGTQTGYKFTDLTNAPHK